MGELVQNAHIAAAADSKGKKVKSLTPYLNDLYVKATVGDATLFQTKEGKTMSADKLNMLIGGLSKQALAAGKFGEASPAQAKKLIIAHFQKLWNDPSTNKAEWAKRTNKGESPFFAFMRSKIQ